MKIVEIIFTRNEASLLKENINFHRKMGVDFFIVTESGSTDDTVKILKRFQSMGLVKYFSDPKIMAQKENMDKMAMMAKKKYKADWVMVSDTDEFWYAKGGLKKFLSRLPQKINTLKVFRFQHFPTEKDNPLEKKTHLQMPYRENGQGLDFDSGIGNEKNNFARKKVMFKPIADDIDIMIGNHTVHFSGREDMEVDPKALMIHEYPFRSYKQFKEKVVRAKEVFSKNAAFKVNKKLATHWRMWLDYFEKGELEDFYHDKIYFSRSRINNAIKHKKMVYDPLVIKEG